MDGTSTFFKLGQRPQPICLGKVSYPPLSGVASSFWVRR